MPKQLLDRLERRAAHREVRSEGVPQLVPADPPDPRPLACAMQRTPARVACEHCAVVVTEHELAALVPMLEKRSPSLVAQRHLPRTPVLGRAHLAARRRPAHHQTPGLEIHIPPPKREKFADAQAGAGRDSDDGSPLGLR